MVSDAPISASWMGEELGALIIIEVAISQVPSLSFTYGSITAQPALL